MSGGDCRGGAIAKLQSIAACCNDTTAPYVPPRQLGFWMALALVVGNMIGSGIFLLPANLAPFGTNALIGWMVTIAGSMCLATVFAAMARAIPRRGPYDYVGPRSARHRPSSSCGAIGSPPG